MSWRQLVRLSGGPTVDPSPIGLHDLTNRIAATPTDGLVSLMGSLTAFVSETTMALIEDSASLGSRQIDMGNSG